MNPNQKGKKSIKSHGTNWHPKMFPQNKVDLLGIEILIAWIVFSRLEANVLDTENIKDEEK